MMKNFMRTCLVFLAVVCLAGCDGDAGTGADLTIVTQKGKEYGFEIEVAITPAQMQKGLMNRTQMPRHHGMLFWFGGAEEERGFWMKNTLIPLDMLFIRADGTIHTIKTGKPEDLTTVYSDGPVAAVLEINGGLSEKWGIQPGDKVYGAFFGNPPLAE